MKFAQWTSPVIQNELLQIIADLIHERNTNDVRASWWYGIILHGTSDNRTEQVSLGLSFALNATKTEAFIGFYSTKSTEGEVLYELVKCSELNLDRKNIVGIAFDAAADINSVHKGVSPRMEECSRSASTSTFTDSLVPNLALQDTMTQIKPLRNTLGIVQVLYNFLEASPKRHALFSDTGVQGEYPAKTDAEVIEYDSMVMPVGNRRVRIWTNGMHYNSPAHAVFRRRSENLLWEQSLVDRH